MASEQSYTREFLLGGSAAMAACLFTNPLEVVKTRLQLQGELAKRGTYTTHYRNFFHAFITIARKDGVTKLQSGLSPGLTYQMFMNGARLGSYQYFVSCGLLHTTDAATGERRRSFPRSVFFGAIAGSIGAFIGSPFYMIKTHMQARASQEIAVGYQHDHRGMWDAFRKIFGQHGIRGLWRGWQAQIIRVIVGSGVQLSTFSASKQLISRNEIFPQTSLLNTFLASMLSGVAVTVFMSPFDVLSTRIYNQPIDKAGRGLYYKGVVDAVYKIVTKEGVFALYKGASAVFFRLGPHTVLSLVFWDTLRQSYFKVFHPDEECVSTG